MGRWLRSPVWHFVVIGGLLFGCRAFLATLSGKTTGGVTRVPVVISAQQIQQLQADFERQWGAPPTSSQVQALIQHAIEDELLYREARRLRLDFGDRSIRLRLIQKMRAVSADPWRHEEALYREAVALGLDNDLVIRRALRQKMRLLLQQDPHGTPLREQDLREYLERHQDRLRQPATITFTQVFLSARVRGDHLHAEAAAVLAQLRAQSVPPEATDELSDPFPLEQRLRALSWHGIARYFGASFAAQVFELEPETWSEPLTSPFGLHLVWVHEKVPERMPPLDAVRQQIAAAVMQERAVERLASGLQRLRHLYDVRVEMPDDIAAPGTALRKTP